MKESSPQKKKEKKTTTLSMIKWDRETGKALGKIDFALKLAAKPITTSEEEEEKRINKKHTHKKKRKKVGTFFFTEEDVHVDLLNPTQRITDFKVFIQHLEHLEKENKIKEYHEGFNQLVNQLAQLDPPERIQAYINILYENIDASKKIICYLWNNVIRIYQTHFQSLDRGKKLLKKLDDILETNIIPYVKEDIKENLNEIMTQYQKSDYQALPNRTFSQFSSSLKTPRHKPLKSSESSLSSSNMAVFLADTSLHHALKFKLPHDTTSYTVPKGSPELIVATQRGIFFYNIKTKEFELLKKYHPHDKKNRYHITAQKKKDPTIHILTAKPSYVPTTALVAWFGKNLLFYFRGKKSGKIVVDNNSAQTVRKLIGHKAPITGLVPLHRNLYNADWVTEKNPKGLKRQNLIASSSRDGTVKIWNFFDQTCLQTIQSEIGPLDGLAKVKPNFLVFSSRQRYFEVWEDKIEQKKDTTEYTFEKARSPLEIVYSPILSIVGVEDTLLTGLKNSSLLVWKVLEGKCIHEELLEGGLPITKLTKNHTALMVLQESARGDKHLTLFMTPRSEQEIAENVLRKRSKTQ